MRNRKLAESSYSTIALETIAQIGLVRRSELSQTIQIEKENGEITSGVGKVGLTRGITRLKEKRYIDTITVDEKKYFFVTEDGWSYLKKSNSSLGYRMNEFSIKNKADIKLMLKRAIGLSLYKTMFLATLPNEKPSLASLVNRLSNEHILDDIPIATSYNQLADVNELFNYGVFYDVLEVKDTLIANGYYDIGSLKTTIRGIIINAAEVIFVYEMCDKRTVIFPRVEQEFCLLVCDILKNVFFAQNRSPEFAKICNIIASDLRYLPTLVTGHRDGIKKIPTKVEVYTFNRLSTMCAKRLLFFDKIHIVPRIADYLEYRGEQYDYSENDYEIDLKRVMKIFPEPLVRVIGSEKTTLAHVETDEELIICRYPDAKELYQYRLRFFEKRKKISVIGIDDPSVADYISRSLQGAMNKYYSINTMQEIPVVHYNDKGYRIESNGAKAIYIDNHF